MSRRILILCTGNSCRSQMVEGFLKSFDQMLEVDSAGTKPANRVHPLAIRVMNEININITDNRPKNVDAFINDSFNYVITVCDNAKETCPVFVGNVGQRLHFGFDDPAEAKGTEEEILLEFRKVRDKIQKRFEKFYREEIQR